MARLEIVNPVAETVKYEVEPATRSSDLRDKTVGLYWNIKAGGDIALERAAKLLSERFKGTRFQQFIGSYGDQMSDLSNFSLKDFRKNAKDQIDKILIEYALEKTGWNRRKASNLLGFSYRALLYKIEDLKINPPPLFR